MTGGNLPEDSLVIIWTSGDRDVALKMVFMYALNSKLRGWWPNVTLVIWGPSARLLAGDAELQNKVQEMKHAGVALLACKACSDSYGVSEALACLGVEVKYMGLPATELLREGHRVLTF